MNHPQTPQFDCLPEDVQLLDKICILTIPDRLRSPVLKPRLHQNPTQ
jgi:hypothetical protein